MTVLTVGETMALFDPREDGIPVTGQPFTLRFAGAESNFAIALARLEIPVRWISRLGRDPMGDMIERGLMDEGVDTRWVVRDSARTGAFIKLRNAGRTSVHYYRNDSAASRLTVKDVPDAAFEGVRVVHLSGITLALSDSARELVCDVARRAHEKGITVVFDPNYRPALWWNAQHASDVQREILPYVSWYLTGLDEGEILWKRQGAEHVAAAVREAGVKPVVRTGIGGAFLDGVAVPPMRIVEVADEMGAGDAFAAGFVYGLLQEWPPQSCVRAGNAIAAAALLGTGDWETLPRLADVQADFQKACAPPPV
jgi:2-dehydro-3-deoxygluconokinase